MAMDANITLRMKLIVKSMPKMSEVMIQGLLTLVAFAKKASAAVWTFLAGLTFSKILVTVRYQS